MASRSSATSAPHDEVLTFQEPYGNAGKKWPRMRLPSFGQTDSVNRQQVE